MDKGIYQISALTEEEMPMSRAQLKINNMISMERDRNAHTRSIFIQKPYYMQDSVRDYGKSK